MGAGWWGRNSKK